MKKYKFPYSQFDALLLSAFLSICSPTHLLDVNNYKKLGNMDSKLATS